MSQSQSKMVDAVASTSDAAPCQYFGPRSSVDIGSEAARLMRFGSFLANNGAVSDDVWLDVLQKLPFFELAILRRVCKSLRRMVPMELTSRFLHLLVRYMGNMDRAKKIQQCMEITQSVIAGGEALDAVMLLKQLTDNLDFFTPRDMSQVFVDLIIGWGGKIIPSVEAPAYGVYTRLAQRMDTHSVVVLELDGRRIHIIESTTPTAMHAVLDGWSTGAMNVITARYFVIPFPHLTTEKTALYNGLTREGLRDVDLATVRKYEKRGIQHFDTTIYGDFGTKCMSDWWTIFKTDRVCVLPMDYAATGIPPEFAHGLRWRVGATCMVIGCPHIHDDDEQEDELTWINSLRGASTE